MRAFFTNEDYKYRTYCVVAKCRNCLLNTELLFSIHYDISDHECPICGCKRLEATNTN